MTTLKTGTLWRHRDLGVVVEVVAIERDRQGVSARVERRPELDTFEGVDPWDPPWRPVVLLCDLRRDYIEVQADTEQVNEVFSYAMALVDGAS